MSTEPEKVICADCGAVCIPSTSSTGYATYAAGTRVCYSCADKRQREELRDRSKPFCAYVSSDEKQITTWTGGQLMKVLDAKPCKLSRVSFTHDMKSFMSIRAVDCHGGYWFGRGSAGICIKMRPVKAKGLTMPALAKAKGLTMPALTKAQQKLLSRPDLSLCRDWFSLAAWYSRSHQREAGKALTRYGDHGSQISGVVRDHFPEEVKVRLRHSAHLVSECVESGFRCRPARVQNATLRALKEAVYARNGRGFYG
jgi:hypothetical protein